MNKPDRLPDIKRYVECPNCRGELIDTNSEVNIHSGKDIKNKIIEYLTGFELNDSTTVEDIDATVIAHFIVEDILSDSI